VKRGNEVVSTKNKNGDTINKYHTNGKPLSNNNPPIFLITDNFTASASEIFAGCMKHYSDKNHNNLMVFHVGLETFGKGSVQEVIPISNGCALKLTTMTYFLPDNTPIQAKGIAPDIFIKQRVLADKQAWLADLYGKEKVLKNHIPADGKKQEKKKEAKAPGTETKEELAKNWEERYRKAVCDDAQIQNCINMINMVNLAKMQAPETVKTRQKALTFLKRHYAVGEKLELARVL
jgi:carboxyl-terminal processing protease